MFFGHNFEAIGFVTINYSSSTPTRPKLQLFKVAVIPRLGKFLPFILPRHSQFPVKQAKKRHYIHKVTPQKNK